MMRVIVIVLLVAALAGCGRDGCEERGLPSYSVVTNRDGAVSVVGADGQRYKMMELGK